MTDGATLALGASAPQVRRRLGPVAWSALEVLATHAVRDGDVLVARVGVRRLAEEMGVATNTAARAARALVAQGLVVHSQRRACSGRFERGLYEFVLPYNVFVLANETSGTTTTIPVSTRTRTSDCLAVEQLALLPE